MKSKTQATRTSEAGLEKKPRQASYLYSRDCLAQVRFKAESNVTLLRPNEKGDIFWARWSAVALWGPISSRLIKQKRAAKSEATQKVGGQNCLLVMDPLRIMMVEDPYLVLGPPVERLEY